MTDNVQCAYTVKRLNAHNLSDLALLHRAVYGFDPPKDYYPKKYDTEYTGVMHTGFLAYNSNGEAIAYYGVIPCFIEYLGETALAAQSADTMTHPAHRYKGMFVELSQLCFALCRDVGIRLIFGFPNQNSYHGAVNKLGWKMTHSLDYFSIPVRSIPMQLAFSKIPALKKLFERYSKHVLKKYTADGLAKSSVLLDGFAGLSRHTAYVRYKTFGGSQMIRMGSSTIWINLKNGLRIGDIDGVDEENFPEIIGGLKSFARRLGIKEISFHCSAGTRLHAIFSRHYRAQPSFAALFQDFGSSIVPESVRFTFADLDIF